MLRILYFKNTLIHRLKLYFAEYFKCFSKPASENLFLIVLAAITLESFRSIRFLYEHFISKVSIKSLNAFYYTCSYAKVDFSKFASITVRILLKLIPHTLDSQPVFLVIDDTLVEKFGVKFQDCSKLFDHAAHNGSNYLNGHCFVSLVLCVPVLRDENSQYICVPLSYRLWTKETSKLELAAGMVESVMPLLENHSVILLCDSWYPKGKLTALVDDYRNLNLICNVQIDSVLCDLPPARTGKRGRPRKQGSGRIKIVQVESGKFQNNSYNKINEGWRNSHE